MRYFHSALGLARRFVLVFAVILLPAIASAQPATDAAPTAGPPASTEETVAEGTEGAEPVIPPGQDERLAEMFGRGVELPGPCKFSGGGADGPAIRATYTCPGGEIALRLVHPRQAPAGATSTEKFAIVILTGTPPEGMVAELAARIRARESAFEWAWIAGSPQREEIPIALYVAAAVAVVVLGLALRWRRSTRPVNPR